MITTVGTFSQPVSVAVDSNFNVFVAETSAGRVRRVDAVTGAVTSIGTSADPPFSGLTNLAVDADDNVWVSDNGNNLVRKIVY